MDLKLSGRKVIVNGGARGIGREAVLQFAAEGCDVAFLSRHRDLIDDTVDAAAREGSRVFGDVVDMTDSQAYSAWLAKSVERLGGCDIFVHTASSSGAGAAGDWDLSFKLDVMGAVRACEVLENPLQASGSGAAIFLSSTAAVETFFRPQAFNAMKAALITYGKQLSQHWAPKNIRVNLVTPGPVEFPGGNWDKIRASAPAAYEATVKSVALGRLGAPADVVGAILFLASPVSGYITGTNIVVDGGMTKRVQF